MPLPTLAAKLMSELFGSNYQPRGNGVDIDTIAAPLVPPNSGSKFGDPTPEGVEILWDVAAEAIQAARACQAGRSRPLVQRQCRVLRLPQYACRSNCGRTGDGRATGHGGKRVAGQSGADVSDDAANGYGQREIYERTRGPVARATTLDPGCLRLRRVLRRGARARIRLGVGRGGLHGGGARAGRRARRRRRRAVGRGRSRSRRRNAGVLQRVPSPGYPAVGAWRASGAEIHPLPVPPLGLRP